MVFWIISLVLHLHAKGWSFDNMINGGDTDYFINPILEFSRGFSFWSRESLGTIRYFPLSRFFLTFPAVVFNFLFENNNIVNLLYFTTLFTLPGIFMFELLSHLKLKRFAVWVGAIFYMINIYIYMKYQFPVPHLHLAYACFPLALSVFIKSFDGSLNYYWGMGIFSVILMAISRAASSYLLYWSVVPVVALLINYAGLTKAKYSFKKLFLFFIVVFILNSVVWVSYVASSGAFEEFETSALTTIYREQSKINSQKYNLFDVMAGFGQQAWVEQLSDVRPGYQAYSFIGNLPLNYLRFLAFVPILFACLANIKKRVWILVLFAVSLAVMATGYGQPFGRVYNFLFDNLPVYRDMFRDMWTYWSMPYFMLISILLANGFDAVKGVKLKEKWDSKLFPVIIKVSIISCWLISITLLTIVPNKLVSSAWIVNIPDEYYQTAEFINSKTDLGNVLLLPMTEHPYGYTDFDWGYTGPDVLRNLSRAGFIDKYFNPVAPASYIQQIEKLNTNAGEMDILEDFLKRTDTDLLVLRKDLLTPVDTLRAEKWIDKIAGNRCFAEVLENDNHLVFEYRCSDFSNYLSNGDKTHLGNIACEDSIMGEDTVISRGFCGELKPDISTISIAESSLRFYPSQERFVEEFSDINESEKADLDIEISDDAFILDISEGKRDLVENWSLNSEMWNGESLQTCNPFDGDVSTGIRKIKTSDGMKFILDKKQACVYQKIITSGDFSKAILAVKHDNKNVSTRYCIFSEGSNTCISQGAIYDPQISSNSNVYSEYNEAEDMYTEYLFIDSIPDLDEEQNIWLYMYFNTNLEEDVEIDIDQIRLLTFPEYKIINPEKTASNRELTPDYDLETFVTLKNVGLDTGVFTYGQNYTDQWLLLGKEKDGGWSIISEERIKTFDFANGWRIEEDKDYEKVYLIFRPQIYYLIGIAVNMWIFFIYLVVAFIGKTFSKKFEKVFA